MDTEVKIQALATIAARVRDAAKKLEDSSFVTLVKEDAIALFHDIATGFEHVKDLFSPSNPTPPPSSPQVGL